MGCSNWINTVATGCHREGDSSVLRRSRLNADCRFSSRRSLEPEPSQLELDGKAHFMASVGETVGFADYATFIATDKYVRENPETLQNWTNAIAKGMKWTATAPMPELVSVISQFFPALKPEVLAHATERYRRLKIWKTSPVIEPAAMEKFQDILVQGHVLEPNKRVKFSDLVVTEFFNKAK